MPVIGALRLRQAHDAGAHPQPAGKSRRLALHARGQLGALRARTHQAHLAAQHVHDLRQLVQMQPAQHAPDPGRAGIARRRPHRAGTILRPVDHGAELDQPKRASAQSKARLAVEHRTGTVEPDRDRDRHAQHHPDRQQRECGDADDAQVEGALVAPAFNHCRRDSAPSIPLRVHGGCFPGRGGLRSRRVLPGPRGSPAASFRSPFTAGSDSIRPDTPAAGSRHRAGGAGRAPAASLRPRCGPGAPDPLRGRRRGHDVAMHGGNPATFEKGGNGGGAATLETDLGKKRLCRIRGLARSGVRFAHASTCPEQ